MTQAIRHPLSGKGPILGAALLIAATGAASKKEMGKVIGALNRGEECDLRFDVWATPVARQELVRFSAVTRTWRLSNELRSRFDPIGLASLRQLLRQR